MLSYAVAIFVGAFLLFQIQPLIGKYILPWFGGSPGVWTTCLLFFQTLLLAGYAYAHFLSARFRPRTQALIHGAALLCALAFLPIVPADSWRVASADNPAGRILLLLGATVGVPYVVLSATGPLLQHWFSRSRPGVSPYRLYALSNAGSLLALLSYPFVFEPRLSRHDQAVLWSWGLLAFVIACGYCAVQAARAPAPVATETSQPVRPATRPDFWSQVLWISLPAVASTLLVATTNKLSQDVAVIPFLWVLPLSLYLLSFILCFDHPRWYHRGPFAAAAVLAVTTVGFLLSAGTGAQLSLQVVGYIASLFVACMVCHGELFQLRPDPAYLTRYYLCISAGGALGGFFVGIVAPFVFTQFHELPIGYWLLLYLLGVMCVVAKSRALAYGSGAGVLLSMVALPVLGASLAARKMGWGDALWAKTTLLVRDEWAFYVPVLVAVAYSLIGRARTWHLRMAGAPMVLSMAVGVVFVVQARDDTGEVVEASRNFYGTLTVTERNDESPALRYYALTHGNITHGTQFAETPQSGLPTTYYGLHSGVGLAVLNTPSLGGKRVGVVGLGTGTLAAYGAVSDRYRFYDINPAVEHLARSRFTYLLESKADITVVLGDARIAMEKEFNDGDLQQFDVLALDAFSSDAIPIHLLTKEAFELYLHHTAQEGIIAVHVSNRYLDLEPIVYKIARSLRLEVVTISDTPPEDDWWLYRSTWILVSRSAEALLAPDIVAASTLVPDERPSLRIWTDDYASLLPILR